MEQFVKMSKYAGMREDLVQAGGGNSSIKLDNSRMLIKASGYQMAEITLEDGYATVNYQVIVDFFNNTAIEEITKDYEKVILEKAFISGKKPSIETFLHAITDKYTLHTHPMLVNILTARKNGMSILQDLFPTALIVGYATPGIELSKEYFTTYKKFRREENQIYDIIFLKNHGLIVSGKSGDEVIQKTEKVINILADYLKIDINCYTDSTILYNTLAEITGESNQVVYLTNSSSIEKALTSTNYTGWQHGFCPDCIVYCGRKIMSLKDNYQKNDIVDFIQKYGKPVVILYKRKMYIFTQSIKKAKEIESVLSFSAEVALANINYEIDILSDDEQNFLLNWDAEKYRQNMK